MFLAAGIIQNCARLTQLNVPRPTVLAIMGMGHMSGVIECLTKRPPSQADVLRISETPKTASLRVIIISMLIGSAVVLGGSIVGLRYLMRMKWK